MFWPQTNHHYPHLLHCLCFRLFYTFSSYYFSFSSSPTHESTSCWDQIVHAIKCAAFEFYKYISFIASKINRTKNKENFPKNRNERKVGCWLTKCIKNTERKKKLLLFITHSAKWFRNWCLLPHLIGPQIAIETSRHSFGVKIYSH